MSRKPPPEDVLVLLRERPELAFQAIYRDHFAMVKHMVLKNSGSPADARDLFQETMVVLWEKARDPEFKLTASLKTYVYAIARNKWLKKLRQQGNMKLVEVEKVPQLAVEEDDSAALTENQHLLMEACMRDLGERCRKLLEMFYYQQIRLEGIAQKLDYANTDSVKTQKYKCIQQLRKLALSRQKP